MWRRRALCNSNSGPNSIRKMWRRNWSRKLRSDCFTCRWRTPFWRTTFTARQRRPSYWPRTPSRPNTATMTRNFTLPVTWPTTVSFRNGIFYLLFLSNHSKLLTFLQFQQSHGSTQSDEGAVGGAHLHLARGTRRNAQVKKNRTSLVVS